MIPAEAWLLAALYAVIYITVCHCEWQAWDKQDRTDAVWIGVISTALVVLLVCYFGELVFNWQMAGGA